MVRIIRDKRWGDSEEVCWTVEWTGECPLDENGDRDIDRAKQHSRSFKTPELAREYARVAANLDKNEYGIASVTKYHLEYVEGSAWDWEAGGEPEYFESTKVGGVDG